MSYLTLISKMHLIQNEYRLLTNNFIKKTRIMQIEEIYVKKIYPAYSKITINDKCDQKTKEKLFRKVNHLCKITNEISKTQSEYSVGFIDNMNSLLLNLLYLNNAVIIKKYHFLFGFHIYKYYMEKENLCFTHNYYNSINTCINEYDNYTNFRNIDKSKLGKSLYDFDLTSLKKDFINKLYQVKEKVCIFKTLFIINIYIQNESLCKINDIQTETYEMLNHCFDKINEIIDYNQFKEITIDQITLVLQVVLPFKIYYYLIKNLKIKYKFIPSFKLVLFYLNLQKFHNHIIDYNDIENIIDKSSNYESRTNFINLLSAVNEMLKEIKFELTWRAKNSEIDDIRKFYSTFEDICFYFDEIEMHGFSILDFKFHPKNKKILTYFNSLYNNKFEQKDYFSDSLSNIQSKLKLKFDLDEYKSIIRYKLNKILHQN